MQIDRLLLLDKGHCIYQGKDVLNLGPASDIAEYMLSLNI